MALGSWALGCALLLASPARADDGLIYSGDQFTIYLKDVTSGAVTAHTFRWNKGATSVSRADFSKEAWGLGRLNDGRVVEDVRIKGLEPRLELREAGEGDVIVTVHGATARDPEHRWNGYHYEEFLRREDVSFRVPRGALGLLARAGGPVKLRLQYWANAFRVQLAAGEGARRVELYHGFQDYGTALGITYGGTRYRLEPYTEVGYVSPSYRLKHLGNGVLQQGQAKELSLHLYQALDPETLAPADRGVGAEPVWVAQRYKAFAEDHPLRATEASLDWQYAAPVVERFGTRGAGQGLERALEDSPGLRAALSAFRRAGGHWPQLSKAIDRPVDWIVQVVAKGRKERKTGRLATIAQALARHETREQQLSTELGRLGRARPKGLRAKLENLARQAALTQEVGFRRAKREKAKAAKLDHEASALVGAAPEAVAALRAEAGSARREGERLLRETRGEAGRSASAVRRLVPARPQRKVK